MRAMYCALLGLVAACQDGFSVDATQDTFCDELAEVACNNLYQCCTESEIEDALGVSEPRTELQCREDLSRACERDSSTLRDSLAAGRVEFDATIYNNCLSALVAPDDTCAEVVAELPWEEVCEDTPWKGKVAIGGTCFFQHDCTGAPDDTFCGPDQKCAARPTAGFPCGSGCAADYYCNLGLCESRVAEGAPCLSNLQCQEDLFCDLTLPMPICAAPQPGGAECASNAACMSGECIPGQCAGTIQQCFTDLQCGSRCADDSAFCTTAADCALGNCSVSGFSCSSNLQCTGGGTDACVFPVQCTPRECVGDSVCTAQQVVIDYCELSLGTI